MTLRFYEVYSFDKWNPEPTNPYEKISQLICIVLKMIPIPCIFEIVQSPICSPITVATLKHLISSPKLNRIPEENLFLPEAFESFPK